MKRRFLIAAPTFNEWELGSYLAAMLRDDGYPFDVLSYWTYPSKRAASEALIEAVDRFSPDVVLALRLTKILPEAIRELRARGVRTFFWYVDCDDPEPPAWIRPLVREVDAFAVTARGMLPKYQALGGAPVHWLVEGVYLPAHPRRKPGSIRVPSLYQSDIAFVGNLYYPSRDKDLAIERQLLLKKIQSRHSLIVWGPQGDPLARQKWGANYPVIEWPAYHEELVKICNGAKIVLGVNRINTVDRYFSNRTFLTLASGGFHLTRYVPGLEEMFTNHKHLVWFRTHEECLELIAHYLPKTAARRKIARAGQDWTRARYGMKRQYRRLLEIVKEHCGKSPEESSDESNAESNDEGNDQGNDEGNREGPRRRLHRE